MAEIPQPVSARRKFLDISNQKTRTYNYGENKIVVIENPQWLNIDKTGHRVVDLAEVAHFLPEGWIEITWEAKDGSELFT
jgi:hypothetical protein